MTDNIKASIAHLFGIGWLAALGMYFFVEKTPLTRFYLRQVLGLMVLFVIAGLFPWFLGTALQLAVVALWIYSLVGAYQKQEISTPIIGKYFQEWFAFI